MSKGRFDNPLIAALSGFFDLFRAQPLATRLTSEDSFSGRTVIVTGANSGLGYALAQEAASREAKVIACGRRQLEQTLTSISEKVPQGDVSTMLLDLSDLASIHEFVDNLKANSVKVDVLYLNAATTLPEARQLPNGQDEMFFVNYLANFILVNLLIEAGCLADDRQPRIVFISSDSHQGASEIDYDEFGRFFSYGVSKAINNYSYFKLVLNTFAIELSRRLNPGTVVTQVNVICPGPVNTNIIKEAPFLLRIMLRAIFTVVFKSPEKAALPAIYLGVSQDFENRSGEYLHMFGEKQMDEKVYRPDAGAKLWEESMQLWQQLEANVSRKIASGKA